MIVKHTYTRSRSAAKAAVRYYQSRPRGKEEPPRTIFTEDGTISRREAYRIIDEHQNGNYVVHRLALSPSAGECPADLVEMTRYAMRELEKQKGQKLHWFAVEHRNTYHPHVHVVIAGTGERDSDGASRSVRLSKDEYVLIKGDAREYCLSANRVEERWHEALGRGEEYRSGLQLPTGYTEGDEDAKQRRMRDHIRKLLGEERLR